MVKKGLKKSESKADLHHVNGLPSDTDAMDTNFDKRLYNLKSKLGNNTKKSSVSESFGIKIVSDVISGLIVGSVLGYVTDKFLGTSPLFLILLMVFGFFMGFYIFYKDLERRQGLGNKSKKNKLGK